MRDIRPLKRFTVISGCSGGGKSTLLAELKRRGAAVVEEPGRRIVAEERARQSTARLPWVDPVAFARRAVDIALNDRAQAKTLRGRVFFDRGLVDACAALAHFSGEPLDTALLAAHPYGRRVFVAPPWPEIYAADADRRHDVREAMAEYERLLDVYETLGYAVTVLAKEAVSDRADAVLATLAKDD